MQSSRLIAEVD